MNANLLLSILAVGACSSKTTPKVNVVDGPPPDEQHTIPATIGLKTFGAAPVLVAYREHGGAWQGLATTATEFAVAGPSYELLAVCMQGSRIDVGILANLVADASSVFLPCFGFTPGTGGGGSVAVGGTMKQAGHVWMGSDDSSATGPWTYALDVSAGDHELVAFGANQWLVRTGIAISTPATEPAIDLATEGTASHDVAFVLTGAGSDPQSTEVDWLTDHEFAAETATGTTAKLPADAIVGANDLVVANLFVDGGASQRTVEYFYTPGTPPVTAFTLLPKLLGVTFTGATATWTTALPAGKVSFRVSRMSDSSNYAVRASAGFVAGTTTLALDLANVPGWMPAWDLDPAGAYKSLGVSVDVGDATLSTTFASSAGFTLDRNKRAALRHKRLSRP